MMFAFLGGLFAYCGMLVKAPAFTLTASALMVGILTALNLFAYVVFRSGLVY